MRQGGAGATDFGNSLDVLAGLDVILWPDNDDAGRGLMRRVAEKLGDSAASIAYVSVDVPVKGDAFDYFGQGGTVEALLASIIKPRTEPWTEEIPDGYIAYIPDAGGRVCFQFDSIERSGRDLDAEVTVWQEMPGVTRESFGARLNIVSLSGRNMFRQQLNAVFGKEGSWTAKLNRACQLVRQAHADLDDSVVLLEAPAIAEAYLILGFLLGDGPSILFGQGGSAKTYLALLMAICLSLGVPFLGRPTKQVAVLYVDYESSAYRLRQRVERILAGIGMTDSLPALFYWPAKGIPLAELRPAIERKIARENIGAIFVDSAVLAAGADPERSETAARYFNTLGRIGLPSMSVAHVTKQDDDKYPFGSIFYHNSSRITWNVKLVHCDDGDNFVDVGLHNRKVNDDRLEPSFGQRITFEPDGGAVRFKSLDLAQHTTLSRGVPVPTRILSHLTGRGYMTAHELFDEEVHNNEESIGKALRRMAKNGKLKVDDSERPPRYALLDKVHKA